LGLIGLYKNFDLKNEFYYEEFNDSILNFTRVITLNPTLSEAFYFRSILRSYISIFYTNNNLFFKENDQKFINKHNNINDLYSENNNEKNDIYLFNSISSNKLNNTLKKNSRNTNRFNSLLNLNNLNSKSLFKESLNDIINSIHLLLLPFENSIKNLKKNNYQYVYYLKLLIFKIFLLFKLSKIEKSIIDIKNYLEIDTENIFTPEVFTLYSLILNEKSFLNKAFDLDKEQRLIKIPNDKLFYLIYSIFENIKENN
jgi:hypothetical protein